MTNKLVVIINSLKVPKIKTILLYEMKFLVPNYSCLQNLWLGGYRPQIPILSVLNWICCPRPPNKIPGYATVVHFFLKWEMFQTKVVEGIKTHILCSVTFLFYFENPAFYEIVLKTIVERGRPQMTIWRMRIACWIPEATKTRSEYVILTAISLQQWFYERA